MEMNMAAQLVARLLEKGWRIAFAESCTGGLAAAGIVDVPGSSGVLDLSIVTYANEAKVRFVKVDPKDIAAYGVVSEPVAQQMAAGIAKAAGAQVGVGISGIAGPGGATPGKPVGTVCFGFFIDGSMWSVTEHFGDIGRNAVRQKSVEYVYHWLLAHL
jgi:nicotinamide-nucleotide amidase